MSVATTLSRTHVVVEPGDEESFEILVRNTGDVVDQFAVTVLGRSQKWTTVEPSTVNLMPGTEQTVTLFFRPPKSPEARAGEVPVAVRVVSREDPTSVVVEEGTVEVKPFVDLDVHLEPPKKRGARSARYKLHVENRGNCSVKCRASGFHQDEDDQLDVTVAHPEFTSEPGTESTTRVRAKPHKRFMRGQPQTLPFVVEVGGDKMEQPTLVDGVMIQNPMLPAWLIKLLLLTVAAIAALVMWLMLFAPQPETIATASGAAAALEEVPPENVPPPAAPTEALPPEVPAETAPAAPAEPVPPAPPEAPALPQPAAAAPAPAPADPAAAAAGVTPEQQAVSGSTGSGTATPPTATQPGAPGADGKPAPTSAGPPRDDVDFSATPPTPDATGRSIYSVTVTAPKGRVQQYYVGGAGGAGGGTATVTGPMALGSPPAGQKATITALLPDGQTTTSNAQATPLPITGPVTGNQVLVVDVTCEEPPPGALLCSFTPTFDILR